MEALSGGRERRKIDIAEALGEITKLNVTISITSETADNMNMTNPNITVLKSRAFVSLFTKIRGTYLFKLRRCLNVCDVWFLLSLYLTPYHPFMHDVR